MFSGFSSIYQQKVLTSQKTQLVLDRAISTIKRTCSRSRAEKKLETAHASILSGREALKLATASSDEARRK